MREQDAKIAEWAGHSWVVNPGSPCFKMPKNYTTSDADAITLLPVLVERGYQVELANTGNGEPQAWGMWIFIKEEQSALVKVIGQPTISASISSAILELIERGSV